MSLRDESGPNVVLFIYILVIHFPRGGGGGFGGDGCDGGKMGSTGAFPKLVQS